jgi:hypothetical protein
LGAVLGFSWACFFACCVRLLAVRLLAGWCACRLVYLQVGELAG